MNESQFLVCECHSGQRTRCVCYQSVSLGVAVSYLREVVTSNPQHHPKASVFASDLCAFKGRLENPAFSVLAVFDAPESITQEASLGRPIIQTTRGIVQMVVKRTTPAVYGMTCPSQAPRKIRNEFNILQRIPETKKDMEVGWKSLPRILYRTIDLNESGMHPILVSDGGINWGTVVTAYRPPRYAATQHRNPRCLDRPRHRNRHQHQTDSCRLPRRLFLLSPTVIGKLNNLYLPTPADDCLSVLLLVNSVLFPARSETFPSVAGFAGNTPPV